MIYEQKDAEKAIEKGLWGLQNKIETHENAGETGTLKAGESNNSEYGAKHGEGLNAKEYKEKGNEELNAEQCEHINANELSPKEHNNKNIYEPTSEKHQHKEDDDIKHNEHESTSPDELKIKEHDSTSPDELKTKQYELMAKENRDRRLAELVKTILSENKKMPVPDMRKSKSEVLIYPEKEPFPCILSLEQAQDERYIACVMNKAYIPHLNAQQRYQLFYGGASSGKSVFLAQRLVLDLIKGRNYLVVRQVAGRVQQSCYNEILKAMDMFGVRDKFKVTKSSISIESGGEVLFAGLDDPEKIKSITPKRGVLTDIWIEEATEIKKESFLQLNKRLRGLSEFKKRLTLSFNPTSKGNWIYKHFFEGKDIFSNPHVSDDVLIFKSSYLDNKYLCADDIAALKDESDELFHRVYTLGEWGLNSEQVLKSVKIMESYTDYRKLPVRFGLDFGFSKSPTVVIKAAIDKGKKAIYILDELCLFGKCNDELAIDIRIFAGHAPVFCDSAEPKSIAELRRYGIQAIPAKKGKDSLKHGIQWLNGYTIYVMSRCKGFYEEAESWCYRKDGFGNILDEPEKGNKHYCDALRYAMEDFMLDRFARVI